MKLLKLFKTYIDRNKQRLLKIGQIKDSLGKIYQIDRRGTVTRVWPERPWRGKSERRAVIKMRRTV